MGATLEKLLNELGRLSNMADTLQSQRFPDEAAEALRAESLARIEEELRGLIGATDDKVDAVGSFILKLQRRADDCREDSRALAQRAKVFENKVDWLKGHVLFVMGMSQRKKLEGTRVTMTMVKGRETPKVDNAAKVPDAYLKQSVFTVAVPAVSAEKMRVELAVLALACGSVVEEARVPDMDFIKVALSTGEVPGASVHVSDPSLRVYVAQREGLVEEGADE